MNKISNALIFIYGQHSPDWMQALASDAPVWPLVLDSGRVVHVTEHDDLSGLVRDSETVVVIPLLEHHNRTAPREFASLVPGLDILEIFADKARFHREMARMGLSGYLPQVYGSALNATFPCVLKRTDLNGGAGIVQASNPEELFALRHAPLWTAQDVLIEEFIPGAKEYVTHAVCSQGCILWHHTFQYVMRDEDPIRRPQSRFEIGTMRLDAATLSVFAKILASFAYDGPVNIDFKIRKSRPVILEINPRLGGSLMRPEYKALLAHALRHIISAALQKWPHQNAASNLR